MYMIGKSSKAVAGLLLVCVLFAGCAPAHTPPVDLQQNSVLFRDTSLPGKTIHVLIADNHLLVVNESTSDRSPAARRMYALENPDATTLKAMHECTTLCGDESTPAKQTPAQIRRTICPNTRINQLQEDTTQTHFPGSHPLQASLKQLYDAVNSPGYEVRSAPTWAFRSRTAIETLQLDATP